MAGCREMTGAGPVHEPVRGRTAGVAIGRRVANAALAIAAAVPVLACAADRYALGPGASVRGSDSMPATAPASSAKGYSLHGGIARGEVDSIFADGFDLNPSYDVAFANDIPLDADVVELASVAVPAGSYAVFVRLQARTGDDPDPGNSYRLDCYLSPANNAVYRVGTEPLVERYLNYQGAVTLDAAGTIRFSCRSANQHEATALSGKLTVVAVGGVD